MIEIPLTSEPEQLFSTSISGVKYNFRVIYGIRSGWSMSISTDNEDLLDGVSLVGGVDLFKQHNIPIKNAYIVNLNNPSEDATSDNMGTSVKLFILTDDEVPQ